jgi:hypothetical protein
MTYYIKNGETIYRFCSFADLEDFTNSTRNDMPNDLGAAICKVFPEAEFSAFHGAVLKGWVKEDGEPTAEFKKGNMWKGREQRNYRVTDFNLSEGGKL